MSGVEIEFSASIDGEDGTENNESIETEIRDSASAGPNPNGAGRRRIEGAGAIYVAQGCSLSGEGIQYLCSFCSNLG